MKRLYYDYKNFLSDCNKIVTFFKDKKINAIIALSRGGLSLAQVLSYKLDIRDVFCIRVIGYEKEKKLNSLKILDNPNLSKFQNVLIVDDIIDSGRSINEVKNLISKQNVNIFITSLFYKKDSIIKPHFYCNIAKSWIDFWWEIDIINQEEIDLYQKISNSEFSKIWDNKEDSVYDRYLSI
jgi:xanthine phosphoribosyltransferase